MLTSFSCEEPITPVKNEANVVWSKDVGRPLNLVKPIIDNGFTYVAADTTIKCIKLNNGTLVWETSLGFYFSGNIASTKLLYSV